MRYLLPLVLCGATAVLVAAAPTKNVSPFAGSYSGWLAYTSGSGGIGLSIKIDKYGNVSGDIWGDMGTGSVDGEIADDGSMVITARVPYRCWDPYYCSNQRWERVTVYAHAELDADGNLGVVTTSPDGISGVLYRE